MRLLGLVSSGVIALLSLGSCTMPSKMYIVQNIAPESKIVIPDDRSQLNDHWTILIDPGHGGDSSKYPQLGTPGEYSSSENPDKKEPERAVNLRVSLALEKSLKSDPRFTVLMTRRDNRFIKLQKRAAISNENNVDAFLSIHSNAVANDRPEEERALHQGFTPIFSYRAKSDLSLRRSPIMAAYIGAALVDAGFKPGPIGSSPESASNCTSSTFVSYWEKYGVSSIWTGHKGLAVLTQNSRPAVLLETHYMSSPSDVENFQNEKSIEKFVDAIKRGLVAFLQNPESLSTSGSGVDPLTSGLELTNQAKDRCAQK